MKEFMEFVEQNKWAVICSFIAVILIGLGAVKIIMNLIFFVGMLVLGVFIDREPEKVNEFFKKLKNEKEGEEN